MLLQLRHQPRELLRERLAVVLLLLGPNIAARREDEAVLFDFGRRRGLAEAGDVAVGPLAVLVLLPPLGRGLAAPLAEGVDDAADVGGRGQVTGGELAVGQDAERAGLHRAKLPGVDEERFALSVPA